jgi:adenylate cyclase
MSLISPLRSWSTVLNADVVGYAAMAALDEIAAMQALLANMSWLSRAVACHDGRVVDAPGDNLLAEFSSEAAALDCALHVQRNARERNRRICAPFHVTFRIGIHSGALLHVQDKLYGDAVNVAARLQSAATAGGVLVSAATAARLGSSVATAALLEPCAYQLKNIPRTITASQACI